MTHFDRNIVSDFGANTDGLTPSDTAWNAWIDFLIGLDPGDTVTLTIPNAGNGGADIYVLNSSGTHRCSFVAGILGGIAVTINIDDGIAFTGNFGLGYWRTTYDDDLHSSRIETVSAGASSVVLRTPSENSRYAVDQWVIVGGIDPQGFGSPANLLRIEHKKISAINTGTGEITFTTPLIRSYDQDWPLFHAGHHTGGPNGTDCGGPATIILLDTFYDVDVTYNGAGVSFDNGQQIYCKCRKATFNGSLSNKIRFLSDGLVPTVGVDLELNNHVNGEAELEVDKMFGEVRSTDGEWTRVKVQSGVGTIRLTNDVVTNDIQLARRTILTNVDAGSMFTGPIAYGSAEEVRINGGRIDGLTRVSGLWDALSDWEWQGSGIFRTANNGPHNAANPGVWMWFGGNREYGVPFQVTDAWQDGGFLYIQTTLTEYPTFNMGTSGLPGPTRFTTIPCLRVHAHSVSSIDLNMRALNNAPQGRPFWEYNERTFSGAYNGATAVGLYVIGELQKIVVDVTQAYTGAQSTCRLLLDQFGVFLKDATHTIIRPSGLYVNLKVTGTRIITPSGVTGSQSGDNLAAMEGWVINGFSPIVNANTTGDTDGQQAIARFQIYTNQGTPDRSFSWNMVAA